MRKTITFYLNGQRCDVEAADASMMLADYLRYQKSLTGTKVVCAEGDCGACSVLRYFPHAKGTDADRFLAINSCLAPVATLDGSHVLTVESLKDDSRLHESQQSMVDCHGSQCGFCTPGFVMAYAGLCEEKLSRNEKVISEKECKNSTTGNLCRCTGYEAIITAGTKMDLTKEKSLKDRYHSAEIQKELESVFNQSVGLENSEYQYFAPKTAQEACDYLSSHQDVRIIASGTDLGVVHNKRKLELTRLMSLHLINDFYAITEDKNIITVGARVTINEFRHFVKNKIPELAHYIDLFASPQIKNNATVIGNVANASPIGDTPPALLALNAEIHLQSTKGSRQIPLHEFFLDYRKTAKAKDELITAISFKLPEKNQILKLYKTSIRKDLDISTVNLGILASADAGTIKQITIAAGGIAAIPLRLKKTEQFLMGKKLDAAMIDQAIQIAHSEFKPLSDVRASASYRRVLMSNYLRRFFSEVQV